MEPLTFGFRRIDKAHTAPYARRMSEGERKERLDFLGLTERDEKLLRDLRPLFEKEVDAIGTAFYDHLLRFPETARLLGDRATVERLRQIQRDYLLRLTEGRFDESYFNDRLRIGQTHERVGLSPRWHLLAYNHHFLLIVPRIFQFYADDPRRACDSILAIEKVFMLDASLAMEAYTASDHIRHLHLLENLVRDSADAIIMLDREKCIRTWNRAAEEIFGWKAPEVIGMHFKVLVPPELIEAGELERIERYIDASGSYQFETVRLTREGRRVNVEVTSSVMRDPQGGLIGRSVILRDITLRKRLEEAKLQAERLAVIGTMSAKLAHEIRNPLSSINMNIDLVRYEIEALTRARAEDGEEARALLKSIHSEVRRIQRVTQDYLKFARIPKPMRDSEVLHELLSERLAFLQSLFDEQKVKLDTKFDPALPPVSVDGEQIWQAVLNIVQNAVEAMPQGGTLTVSTRRDGNFAEVRVADTGKGMIDEQLRQVFKPFFSTKQSGTGLGLPLTQQIIVEHGGQIECKSIAGKGTTFTIRLPIAAKE